MSKTSSQRSLMSTSKTSSDRSSKPATSLIGKPTDFKGSGGAGTSVFGGTTTTPLSAARQRTASEGSEGGGEDDFVPTAVFKPVIPLPPLVETKPGDENENVIFDHR
jgi:hypothetical protein